MNQINKTNQLTHQSLNQSIDFIIYEQNKYFHIFVDIAPEANDSIPAIEDVTNAATIATEISGNMY